MKKGKWRISIDDGYVEYRFIVAINGDECILSVYEKIRKLFKSRRRKAAERPETYPTSEECSTWNDLGALKEKMDRKKDFADFYLWAALKEIAPEDEPDFASWLFNPVRFCQLVADWQRKR